MRYRKVPLIGVILFLSCTSLGFTEDFSLPYFLAKVSNKAHELSKKDRVELLNRMDEILERTQQIHKQMVQALQGGEIAMEYQEGKFWMTKLEEDRESIEAGMQQLKVLKEKPNDLSASVKLYKSLRDLSLNFNAYNNIPSFSGYVGDLAPEVELWADPVFYKLYLLPLAVLKDKEVEKEAPKREKRPLPKK
jgi:hypothetical protein